MSDESRMWLWRDGGFRPVADTGKFAGAVLAADSCAVDAGQARGWPWHLARFCATAGAHVDPDVAARRWRGALALVPPHGRWWPRIDLRLIGDTLAWIAILRPSPPWPTTARVWLGDGDPRVQPRSKGPDLAALARVREAAVERGADEALLTAPDGTVREAGYAALAWWRDDRLHVVDPAEPILPSVTRRLLLAIAAEAGIEIVYARPSIADLDGAETWLLSAGSGLRSVSGWVGTEIAAAPALRAGEWRDRLNAWRLPLP